MPKHHSSVHKKIRDLERLMGKLESPSEEMVEKLRRLKQENSQHKKDDRDQKICDKYHMVKFIERKKLTRKLRKLDRLIADQTSETTELDTERSQLLDNLKYVMYYPKGMKYVGVIPSEKELTESNEVIMKQTNKLREKARILASENYEREIAQGHADLVQHAIDVEYQNPGVAGKKDIFRQTSSGNNSKRKSQLGPETASTKKRKVVQDDYNEFTQPAENDNTSVTAVTEMRTAIPNQTKVKEQSSKSAKELKLKQVAENDSFFLEEFDPATEPLEPSQIAQPRIPFGGIKTGGRSQGNRSRIVDDGSMTKQELRLLRWQEKVRGKKSVV